MACCNVIVSISSTYKISECNPDVFCVQIRGSFSIEIQLKHCCLSPSIKEEDQLDIGVCFLTNKIVLK